MRRALTDENAARVFRIVDKRGNNFDHNPILVAFYFYFMVDALAPKVKEPDGDGGIE